MLALKIIMFVAILPLAVGQIGFSVPGCATSCWDNTKYLSQCLLDDAACFCGKFQYQKSVYQCIYSQCDTAHFASALHHIMSKCVNNGHEILFGSPPILNRIELRRREKEYVVGDNIYGSASVAGYPIESALFRTESVFPAASATVPYLTESASFSTQSVGFITLSAVNHWFPDSVASPSPVYYRRGATTLPSMVTSTPTELLDVASTIVTSAEALSQVSTAAGLRLKFMSTVPAAITIFAVYMAA